MLHLPSLRRFIKSGNGTATIEFVVAIPMFLAALAFAFEFGQIFLAHQDTVDNVRAASRYLARTTCQGADRTVATRIVRTGQISGGASPAWLNSAFVNVTCSSVGLGPQRVRIEIIVDYPLSIFSFAGDARPTIPFSVKEDLPVAGM